MKEIEFRDYDCETKELRYFDLDHYDREEHNSYGNIMQYTGLKDKNGVKIFAYDIIIYDDNEDMNRWVSGAKALIVDYGYKMVARMKPFDKYECSNQNILSKDVYDCVLVIGNIYQNPELLSEVNDENK